MFLLESQTFETASSGLTTPTVVSDYGDDIYRHYSQEVNFSCCSQDYGRIRHYLCRGHE